MTSVRSLGTKTCICLNAGGSAKPDHACQKLAPLGNLPWQGRVPVRQDLLISGKASQSWRMHGIFQITVWASFPLACWNPTPSWGGTYDLMYKDRDTVHQVFKISPKYKGGVGELRQLFPRI